MATIDRRHCLQTARRTKAAAARASKRSECLSIGEEQEGEEERERAEDKLE